MVTSDARSVAKSFQSGIAVAVMWNAIIFATYWGISHLNWIIFNRVGVLPMPIWPAAAVALVGAILHGYSVAPGIALGAIFANHFSLGSSWALALGIAVMNTVGPLLAAKIMRHRITVRSWSTWNRIDVTVVFVAALALAPLLTAIGGIGTKWLLGQIASPDVANAIARWALAHALGTLLFAPPLLVCIPIGRRK